MTCQVFFEFRVKPDATDRVQTWLRKILPDTRAYDGCISITVTQDLDSPVDFTVVEQWETRAQFEQYRDWRLNSEELDEFFDMADGEPTWRFFRYAGL